MSPLLQVYFSSEIDTWRQERYLFANHICLWSKNSLDCIKMLWVSSVPFSVRFLEYLKKITNVFIEAFHYFADSKSIFLHSRKSFEYLPKQVHMLHPKYVLNLERWWWPVLRDRPPKNFSPKPHILDSYGVWYSSFWSEGPKNHRNLKILVSNFVPRGFEAQRDGVWRGGAGVSRHSAMGFGGAAHW